MVDFRVPGRKARLSEAWLLTLQWVFESGGDKLLVPPLPITSLHAKFCFQSLLLYYTAEKSH